MDGFLCLFCSFFCKVYGRHTVSATLVIFLCLVIAHWCLYDSPKEFISLFTIMQDLRRTTFQEGSFIGGNIKLPSMVSSFPFSQVDQILLNYRTAIWPCHVSGVAVLQDLAKSL